MSELCNWLHEKIEKLPVISFPFNLNQLPKNGIYFFYEMGETWGHGGNDPRIVRVGTHRQNNFRSRIKDHFLLDDRKYNLRPDNSSPKDRSIFRKNLGRAILNKSDPDYLKIWNIDFTPRISRDKFSHLRDIEKEIQTEKEISKILKEKFYFRYISVETQEERIGKKGLESSLIGTLAQCRLCKPSENWLGNNSPKPEITESGLWLTQHLKDPALTEEEMDRLGSIIESI